ncbi:MAG: hypothetical protein V2B20_26285 [Pseudomonadota bacterium]
MGKNKVYSDTAHDDEGWLFVCVWCRALAGGIKLLGAGVKMTEKSGGSGDHAGNMGRIGNRPYWVLSLSIVIRAMHLIGASVILSSTLLGDMVRPPSLYLMLASVSGIMLLSTEWLRHRQICRELAGVSTLVKMLLLGAAYHGLLPLQGTVLLVFFLASVASHAPKLVRHRLLF